jgi:predicted Zn-dependent protease
VNCVGLIAALALVATTASAQGGMAIPGAPPAHGGGNGVVVGASLGSTSSATGAAEAGYDAAGEYAKAIAALKIGQFKQAAATASRLTRATPTNPDAWRVLGAAHAGADNWKGSRRAFERALKLLPDDPVAHAGLGLALANLGDPKAWEQLNWLLDRSSACGDTCPDAQRLQRYAVGLEDAIRARAAAATAPG